MRQGYIANGQVFEIKDITQPMRWRLNGNLVEWIALSRPTGDDIGLLCTYLGSTSYVQKWNGITL